MILRQTFKYRLEPSLKKRQLMAQSAGSCRFIWNKALAVQKQLLDEGNKVQSFSELCRLLTLWKKEKETTFLKTPHSQPLQQTLKHLDRALKEAFNKSNPKEFPRFKRKDTRDSFRYPQGFKIEAHNSRIFLPKIGWMKYRKSREIVGTPRNITVSKRGEHWYVSIQTEREIVRPKSEETSIVGGDLGITRFLTLSTGEYFEPRNSFKALEKKLARQQRSLARRVKGSRRWEQLKRTIAKLHIRIANARHDYLHKLSHHLSKNHAVVVLEDLKVTKMSTSAKGTREEPGKHVRVKSQLNKSILDQGWHEFKRQLGYKLEWCGGMLVVVNPKNTSRCCPECGYTSADNRKSQSSFICAECGYQENADLVGASNILRAGYVQLACGDIGLVGGLAWEPAQLTANM